MKRIMRLVRDERRPRWRVVVVCAPLLLLGGCGGGKRSGSAGGSNDIEKGSPVQWRGSTTGYKNTTHGKQ